MTHLTSSCKCFNSLSSSSRLKLETSQRSMSRSVDTFSSSTRKRTTSLVRSIVAILTTNDSHYRHSTSLITMTLGAKANHHRTFQIWNITQCSRHNINKDGYLENVHLCRNTSNFFSVPMFSTRSVYIAGI